MTQKEPGHILFITSNRLGDAVLSMGLLDHILTTYPGAKVTIACGPLPASLFEGYPALHELISFRKEKYNRHWIRLWAKLVKTRWDMVIDLRDSAVSRLIPARQRFIYSRHINQNIHKVKQAAQVMRLDYVPSPRIWFTDAQKKRAAALIPDGGPVLGIGPTSNWIGKTWPAERFIELIKILTADDGILPGARVAVFAGRGEEYIAMPVFNSIPADRRLDLMDKGDPATAVAALSRCDLFIGHDSGLMHSSSAAGTPTIALFGPGWPNLYGPWGEQTTVIRTPESVDELIGYPGYDSKKVGTLMGSLTVATVAQGAKNFWGQIAHQTTRPQRKETI